METIAIWKLSTFCGFYGRIIPNFPTNKENEKFNSFYESYILYDMNGLIEYLKKNVTEEELNKGVNELNLIKQTIIKLDNKR